MDSFDATDPLVAAGARTRPGDIVEAVWLSLGFLSDRNLHAWKYDIWKSVFNSQGPKVISAPGTRMVLPGPSTFNLDIWP